MSDARERLIGMRRFINEYQYAVGPDRNLLSSNLPDPGELRLKTVVMPKETVVRFRNDYLLLLGFAAYWLDKRPEEMCGLDLMAPFLREAAERAENELIEEEL